MIYHNYGTKNKKEVAMSIDIAKIIKLSEVYPSASECRMKATSPSDAYPCYEYLESDLKVAVDLYTLYKTNKSHSMVQNAVKADPRAKLTSIESFGKDENWDINLQWSDKEKEDLGIKKKDNIMSVDEFNSYVGELISERP